MDYGSLEGEYLSPESTVTSLLSNTGHLKSSLLHPENNTTFRFKDKDYESASAALNAYIVDFDSSCLKCRSSSGPISLPLSSPATPIRPSIRKLRNKDVLRESLTERELDFLMLPVSSLRHHDNSERLSMTTDELLSIPCDGTMPVTHTSAFIQDIVSQSRRAHPHCSSSGTTHRTLAHSSSGTDPRLNPHHLTRMRRSFRGRPGAVMFKRHDNYMLPETSFKDTQTTGGSEVTPLQPHDLIGNITADMRRSGACRLRYPSWIYDCDGSQVPLTESNLWDEQDVPPPADVRTGAPSWVAELEDNYSQVDGLLNVRDLRNQFAEEISLLAAERKSSDIMDNQTMLRDSRIECLIQKADQVLNSLSQSCDAGDKPAIGSVNSGEQLSSSCPSLTQEPAAGGATDTPSDTGTEGVNAGLHGNNWMQPGPVEALKQMLFRLQAVESRLQKQDASDAPLSSDTGLHTEESQETQICGGEAGTLSGGPSLHRALHHLNRLKLLVEEPREKRREEEKDEDEGRYSSSSANGYACS